MSTHHKRNIDAELGKYSMHSWENIEGEIKKFFHTLSMKK